MKITEESDSGLINNTVCYNILYKLIQTNLDFNVDFIIDIALGDKKNANWFLDRFDFKDSKVFRFVTVCSDENEWERRHNERITNPLPNQIFKSLEHVKAHYKNADTTPFENEFVIDTAEPIKKCMMNIYEIIKAVWQENG